MGKAYKLDKYRQEADVEPFAFELSENETLLIPCPDGDTILEIEESRSSRRTLELLCGEHFDRVLEIVGAEKAGVLTLLVTDMTKHFGITAEQAPPGGSRASRRS